MSYLALYRRFRPTTFQEVIGQDAIVRTLTNQIKSKNVGHAYLFCGARGTGKTTLAKILAKAVNCLDPVDGSPCKTCAACKILENPSDLNVVEMDAASNNKVENVRAIRDNVQFPPVGVKYKVYIIDEVHMLTTEAFNALLKTLEEPPAHAIFILATTEPQKIPATILSRCMRFDFKLVSTEKIAELIKKIYDELGKSYDLDAIGAIAKAGNGSVRDALSVADTLISYGEGKLTYNDVLDVLGATDISVLDGLSRAVFSSDAGAILTIADSLTASGKSVNVVCRDLLSYMRDLGIIKSVKNAENILNIPKDRFLTEKATADTVGERKLLRAMDILSTVENNARYSLDPRTVFETALLKAALPETDYDIDALLARIGELERQIKELKESGVTIVKEPPKVIFKGEERQNEASVKAPKIKTAEIKTAEIKSGDCSAAENKAATLPAEGGVRPVAVEITGESAARLEKANKVAADDVLPAADEKPRKTAPEAAFDDEFGYALSDADAPSPEFCGEFETLSKNPAPSRGTAFVKTENSGVAGAAQSAIDGQNSGGPQNTISAQNIGSAQSASGAGVATADGKRIWGLALRRLRSMPNKTVLWVACQEMTAKTDGDKLIVNPGGESERKLLMKEDNINVLKSIVAAFGINYIELSGGASNNDDDYEKRATDYFGADNLTVIK